MNACWSKNKNTLHIKCSFHGKKSVGILIYTEASVRGFLTSYIQWWLDGSFGGGAWLLAEETIYSQRSGKWPRQDKFQFSQLEIGGHQKCKREQQFEPDKVSTTWIAPYSRLHQQSRVAQPVHSLLNQLVIISQTFQGGARTSSGKGCSKMPLEIHYLFIWALISKLCFPTNYQLNTALGTIHTIQSQAEASLDVTNGIYN